MSTTTDMKPHSRCLDCPEEFDTHEAAREHRAATSKTRDTEHGPKTGSHRTQVVNPTDAEKRKSRVQGAIESAIDSALSDLDDRVYREEFTEDEIAEALRHWDLSDAWREYTEESR
jgi:hypothetical protein